jgi:phospholipid/cholesterol/gamma-HCH transport system permease protein
MLNVVTLTGHIFNQLIKEIGSLSILFVQTLGLIFVPPLKGERILVQAQRVGPGSWFISCLIAFFIGMIMSLQMAYQMKQLSAEIYIPGVVAVALARELGPVLTALIVAGRMGAGITAEIGSMTVTDQVDALRAFAVNPVKYLVVPRFLALIIMLPILTVFADLIGMMGAYMIRVFKLDITPALFFTMIAQTLDISDVATGLIKTIVFGAIIALVGCHQGFMVTGGAEGVGKSTTVAVVISFILIIMADCMFTTLFYFILKL